jgi:ubiquitin C-terminal hydrolase
MEKIDITKYYDKGRTGLANLGNTCFLNACLQVLNHTYELTAFINSNKYDKNFKSEMTDAIALKEWKDLQKIMWDTNTIVSPNKFVYYIHTLAKAKNREIFTGWAQNDMPEFLLFMIESMHNSLSRRVNIRINGKAQNDLDTLAVKCYEMLSETYAKEYSEIMDIFYGIYVSEIKSIDGSTRHTIKPESFFMLDLPIPNKEATTIYDCFDEFTKYEVLEKDNAWLNEKTGQKEDVKKGITFWNFPNILVLTMKRFSPCGEHKLTRIIDFPVDGLDLSKYVSGYNKEKYVYDLYGVCNHTGNVMGGHYTAFVKNAKGEWALFNDTNVVSVKTNQEVVSPAAYCLFYRKKNSTL